MNRQMSTDRNWFTPKVAAALVLCLYLVGWFSILAIGKQHFLTMRATKQRPRWLIDSHGRLNLTCFLRRFS
jgi:hypothetical protein